MSALRWLRRGTNQLAMVLVCAGRTWAGERQEEGRGQEGKDGKESGAVEKEPEREGARGTSQGSQEGKLSSVWSGRAPREMKCDRRSRTEPHRWGRDVRSPQSSAWYTAFMGLGVSKLCKSLH